MSFSGEGPGGPNYGPGLVKRSSLMVSLSSAPVAGHRVLYYTIINNFMIAFMGKCAFLSLVSPAEKKTLAGPDGAPYCSAPR